MTRDLARCALAALGLSLLCLTGHGLAARAAVRRRRDWWLCARWGQVAEAAWLAGVVLAGAAAVLLGMAALTPGP